MSPRAHIGRSEPPTSSKGWLIRCAVGAGLALGVLGLIFAGSPGIEIVVALTACLGAREWFRMLSGKTVSLALACVSICVALMLFVAMKQPEMPILILGAGALAILMLEISLAGKALWSAFGVFYLGLPALAVVALRDVAPHGAWLTLSLFLAVWATDTGALASGKLIGGPRLAPSLSPNKTWSGIFGGIAAAAGVEAGLAGILDGAVWAAAGYGAGLALAAHAGDLFESALKRLFRVKDSGASIPGHGGVLDRIDSTLSAALALAVLVFQFHFDPLSGARP